MLIYHHWLTRFPEISEIEEFGHMYKAPSMSVLSSTQQDHVPKSGLTVINGSAWFVTTGNFVIEKVLIRFDKELLALNH